MTSHIVYNVNL